MKHHKFSACTEKCELCNADTRADAISGIAILVVVIAVLVAARLGVFA